MTPATLLTPTEPIRTEPWTVLAEADVVFVMAPTASNPAPHEWQTHLRHALETLPVDIVGAMRLDHDGRVASMGEHVVHPKGLHSVGKGLEPNRFRFNEEVDAVIGGAIAIRTQALNGFDPTLIRCAADMIEMCLHVRRRGGRVAVSPGVRTTDNSALPTAAGFRTAVNASWGFDPLAPDMDRVRSAHSGTGLLWNIRIHSPQLPFDKYDLRGPMHWKSYQDVEPYRTRADQLAGLVRSLAGTGRIVDVGCGDGLFSWLFARDGAGVIGFDAEPTAIELAGVQATSAGGPCPSFEVADARALPLPNHSVDVVTMLDVVEHLANPASVLHEASRILRPGGALLVSTPEWQHGASSDPVHHGWEFTLPELIRLVEAAAPLSVAQTGRIGGIYRDLVVIARRHP